MTTNTTTSDADDGTSILLGPLRTFGALTDEDSGTFSLRSVEPVHLSMQPALRAVLMVIGTDQLRDRGGGTYDLVSERLADRSIRPSVRAFADPRILLEHSILGSTALLMTESLVLTAAHVLARPGFDPDLQATRLVFRDHARDHSYVAPRVAAHEILTVQRVVGMENESGDNARDWALLRVAPHAHTVRSLAAGHGRVRLDAPPSAGNTVWYAGHPGGLPLKVEEGRVLGEGHAKASAGTFVASMDIIGGASGSPVFDDQARLTGVLRGFTEDWKTGPAKGGPAAPMPHKARPSRQPVTSIAHILECCEPSVRDEILAAVRTN